MRTDVDERPARLQQLRRPLRHRVRETAHEDLPVNGIGQVQRHPVRTGDPDLARPGVRRESIEQSSLSAQRQGPAGLEHAIEDCHPRVPS
jgi:hypothetical protein